MTANAFSCKTYSKRGAAVVELLGEVNFHCLDLLRAEFAELRQQCPARVILDCSGITLLASVGLGEFAKLLRWGKDNGCDIRIVCFSNPVIEVLEIAGLTETAPVFPSLEMALGT